MYLENFSGSASRTGNCGASETGGTGGTGGRAGAGGTGGRAGKAGRIERAGASVERVETYFLKLYLIDCEIVKRLYTK